MTVAEEKDTAESTALSELSALLEQAHRLAGKIGLEAVQQPTAGRSQADLLSRLAKSEADVDNLSRSLVELERRADRLMNLYVATYQLYAARDPDEVQETIGEIAIDLLGAESFILLLRDTGKTDYRVALQRGSRHLETFVDGRYQGGIEPLDRMLEEEGGVTEILGSPAIAIVPLRFDQVLVGVFLVLELLDHKKELTAGDREVLDLLAAHAASALVTSQSYAATSRKATTLESLYRLAKGA